MSLLDPRRADTTRKMAAHAPRSYYPTATEQIVDLVMRYTTPLARSHARSCLDTFVLLANAGFFSEGRRAPGEAGAELTHTSDGGAAGVSSMDAWALGLRSVGVRGLKWLLGALNEAGARVEYTSVVVPDAASEIEISPNIRSSFGFVVASTRPRSGYYIRLALNEPADDAQEASFQALVRLWTALALGLPSRDGHARSTVTTKPSFERGGHLLGAAGRELDVLRGDAELALLTALAQFDREMAPLHEVTLQLA